MAIPQVMFLFVKSDHCTTVSKTYQTLYTIVTRKLLRYQQLLLDVRGLLLYYCAILLYQSVSMIPLTSLC